MKKSFVFALVLALLLALAAPAFAFACQRSAQSLTVDGKTITCDKYNIEGSNYFKLRDLAKLLDGTGSQFDVGWDADQQLVTITTNHAYTTPNGTELVVGADKSATAVLSAQTIMIDGVVRRDLSVFNIGGSNFFQLREMGKALGFDVDYDAASNTAIVASRGAAPTGAADIRVTDLCGLTGRLVNAAGYSEYYSFFLPKISGADTAYIRSVNAAVQEIYEQHVQTSLSNLAEYGALSTYCVCYRYAVNGGIHSLLITADSDWGENYYWCFNFDDAGNKVDNAAVLKAAGMTEAGFTAAAKAFLTDYTDLSEYDGVDPEFWKPYQEQTIAADNCSAAMPMALLGDGSLCFIATIYTPAGAGQYDYALKFTGKDKIEMYGSFGRILCTRFGGAWLVDGVDGDGMSILLDFFTVGDQLTMEVTAFDAEYGSVFYYFAADVSAVNEADMLRGDLDSVTLSLLSYCPDVLGGSYYGDPGVYTVTFADDAITFSDFAGGTAVVAERFTARRAYLDDLGLDDPVPGTNYDLFDFDAVAAAGITGIWYGTYNDLAGESHGLTLELTSWGEIKLRDVTDTAIPRVMDGSYYIAAEGDQMAPVGDVVFHLVSRAGYKMPSLGNCTMTVGNDGNLRITDSFDGLTQAGNGTTVTLKPVPSLRSTVYTEP